MTVKEALARWLPLAVSERIGLVPKQRSFIPDTAWKFWGYRRDGGILAEDTYERVGWVYGCARAISKNYQQIIWHAAIAKPGQGKDGKSRIEQLPDGHPFAQLLAKPNDIEDLPGLLESTALHLSLRGEAFWELDGALPGANGLPRPAKIYSRPPQWIWKVDVTNDKYSCFHLRMPMYGGLVDIPGENAVFFKYFNPRDPWRGMSPLKACYQAADTYWAASLFNAYFFHNGGAPSLVLKYSKDSGYLALPPDERDRIEKMLATFQAGLHNARKPLILGPGQELDPLGFDPKDMDFANLMRVCKEEMLAVFGVSPIVLGYVDDANRANSIDQRKTFWEETLMPINFDVLGQVNMQLAPRFGPGVIARPDFSSIPALQKNLKAIGDAIIPFMTAGAMTINEGRGYLDLEPVPWGDGWWHSSLLTYDDGVPEEAPPPPALPPAQPPDGQEPKPPEQPKLPGAKQINALRANGELDPLVARRMLSDWKNETIARVRNGAPSALAAFPRYRIANQATKRYGIPRAAAWQLANAAHAEIALAWREHERDHGLGDWFDETLARIPAVDGAKP